MQDGFFRVDGADSETGEETYVVLQAASMEEAEAVARRQGLLIAEVRPATVADLRATPGAKNPVAPTAPAKKLIVFETPRSAKNVAASVSGIPSGSAGAIGNDRSAGVSQPAAASAAPRPAPQVFSTSPIGLPSTNGSPPRAKAAAFPSPQHSDRPAARPASPKPVAPPISSILEFATARSPAPLQGKTGAQSPASITRPISIVDAGVIAPSVASARSIAEPSILEAAKRIPAAEPIAVPASRAPQPTSESTTSMANNGVIVGEAPPVEPAKLNSLDPKANILSSPGPSFACSEPSVGQNLPPIFEPTLVSSPVIASDGATMSVEPTNAPAGADDAKESIPHGETTSSASHCVIEPPTEDIEAEIPAPPLPDATAPHSESAPPVAEVVLEPLELGELFDAPADEAATPLAEAVAEQSNAPTPAMLAEEAVAPATVPVIDEAASVSSDTPVVESWLDAGVAEYTPVVETIESTVAENGNFSEGAEPAVGDSPLRDPVALTVSAVEEIGGTPLESGAVDAPPTYVEAPADLLQAQIETETPFVETQARPDTAEPSAARPLEPERTQPEVAPVRPEPLAIPEGSEIAAIDAEPLPADNLRLEPLPKPQGADEIAPVADQVEPALTATADAPLTGLEAAAFSEDAAKGMGSDSADALSRAEAQSLADAQVIEVTARAVLVPKSGTMPGTKLPPPLPPAGKGPPPPPRPSGVVRAVPENRKPWSKPVVAPARPIGFVPPQVRGGIGSKPGYSRRPIGPPPGPNFPARSGPTAQPRRTPPPPPPRPPVADTPRDMLTSPAPAISPVSDTADKDAAVSEQVWFPPNAEQSVVGPPARSPSEPGSENGDSVQAIEPEIGNAEPERAASEVENPSVGNLESVESAAPAPAEPAPAIAEFTFGEETENLEEPAAAPAATHRMEEPTMAETSALLPPVVPAELPLVATPSVAGARRREVAPPAQSSALILYVLCPLATLTTLGGVAITLLGLLHTPAGEITDVEKIDFHIQTLTQTLLGGMLFVAGMMIFLGAALAHMARGQIAEWAIDRIAFLVRFHSVPVRETKRNIWRENVSFVRCFMPPNPAPRARTFHDVLAIFRRSRILKQNETPGENLFHETSSSARAMF